MIPRVIVHPTEEPISVDEARVHLNAERYGDSTVDAQIDAKIERCIKAARGWCEGYLELSLSTRTLEITLDSFPSGYTRDSRLIDLPMGPVRQVLSVNWGDGSATSSEGELDDADFRLYTHTLTHRIGPLTAWPSVTAATAAVRIRYVAGYGVDSDGGEELPSEIQQAILLLVGHFFANAEDTSDLSLSPIPMGAKTLISRYRVRLGMA